MGMGYRLYSGKQCVEVNIFSKMESCDKIENKIAVQRLLILFENRV